MKNHNFRIKEAENGEPQLQNKRGKYCFGGDLIEV